MSTPAPGRPWDALQGRRLRTAFELAQHNDASFAAACGVSTASLRRAARGDKVHPEALEAMVSGADFFSYEPALLDALSSVCGNWSQSHAAALLAHLEAAGLSLGAAAEHSGVSRITLRNWTQGGTSPQVRPFARVARALEVDVVEFSELASAETDGDGHLNRFAYELRAAQERSGLKPAELAKALGVERPTLSSWLRGRSLPTGSDLLARVELLAGVRVSDVRREAALEKESSRVDLEALPALARLLTRRRLELGKTSPDVAGALGVHVGAFHAWESGAVRPQHAALRALAQELELGLDEVSWAAFGALPTSSFGERLRTARLRAVMSSSEVASALGLPVPSYRNYEALEGQSCVPAEPLLMDLCTLLGAPLEQMLEPDLKLFGDWVLALVEQQGIALVSAVAGTSRQEVESWCQGQARPSLVQAEALGHFSGDGKVQARALVTGERPH
jgi:transcriptional regulator with XRE-family HTH domain